MISDQAAIGRSLDQRRPLAPPAGIRLQSIIHVKLKEGEELERSGGGGVVFSFASPGNPVGIRRLTSHITRPLGRALVSTKTPISTKQNPI